MRYDSPVCVLWASRLWYLSELERACLLSPGLADRLWGESEGKQLFGLAWRGHVCCTYSSLDRVDVGTRSWHVHTYSLWQAHMSAHRLHQMQTHTHADTCTHPLWWMQSQNSLDLDQLHVLCGLYAVWFGLANRLETWQVTSGKSGSHQPRVYMAN